MSLQCDTINMSGILLKKEGACMTNEMIYDIAIAQSAIDYNIKAINFNHGSFNIHKPSDVTRHARNYLTRKPYCNFVYYGDALVVIVDDEMKEFVSDFCMKNADEIYRVFDAPQITMLNNELEKHGKCIAHLAQFYVPDVDYVPVLNRQIETRLFVGEEIHELYHSDQFKMALTYNVEGTRRDMIAIAGYSNNRLVGIAGASNDCETMWQVGIDVLNDFRHQGIASTLTYLLSQEIMKRGIVPFYGCAWSNIASKNTARKAGFKDCWVELTAKDISDPWITDIRTL